MKRVRSARSGLMGESDMASSILANMRKSPAVSVLVVRCADSRSCDQTHYCPPWPDTPLRRGTPCFASTSDRGSVRCTSPGVHLPRRQMSGQTCPNMGALTTENVSTPLVLQLSDFNQCVEETIAGSVDCDAVAKDEVGCWLATAQLRPIFNVVQHQRSPVEQIDNLLDHGNLPWRQLKPSIQSVDDLVSDPLGGLRVKIARWRFEGL